MQGEFPMANPNHGRCCFVLCRAHEYLVFAARNATLLSRCAFPDPLAQCELLRASNILALLFEPRRHEVVFWDDARRVPVARLPLDGPVERFLLRPASITVQLPERAVIFALCDFARVATWPLPPNCRLECPPRRERLFAWAAPGDAALTLHDLAADGAERAIALRHGPLHVWAFDRDGNVLAVLASGGTLRLHDLHGGSTRTLRLGSSSATLRALDFSADATLLATVSADGTVRVLWTSAQRTATRVVDGAVWAFWNVSGELVAGTREEVINFARVEGDAFAVTQRQLCLE